MTTSAPIPVAVVLKIGSGDFETGFPVTLRILEEGRLIQEDEHCAQLPPAPKLPDLYGHWQSLYRQLGAVRGIQAVTGQITHHSPLEACQLAVKELAEAIKAWFAHPSFRSLRQQIIAESGVQRDASLPIILELEPTRAARSELLLLRHLPWHLWDLFDARYLPNAEVVLGMGKKRTVSTFHQPVKILAVFGSREGNLDLERDCLALDQLRQQGAEMTVLEQPNRRGLHEHLWEQQHDILFFGGHSASETGQRSGHLQISDRESLSLDDLREDLNQSIANGLKLCIFNSCDGLGIANYLADLQVPYMVVMKEPVPDRFAREFLREFLREFSQDIPLYLAVRRARNRLHWMESDTEQHPCPAATWLPIVCQNSAQTDLIWSVLDPRLIPHHTTRRPAAIASSKSFAMKPKNPKSGDNLALQVMALLITLTLLGTLAFWAYQAIRPQFTSEPTLSESPPSSGRVLSDRFSVGERQLIETVTTLAKQEGVNAFNQRDYQQAVKWFQDSLKINPNDPESLIYLNNARARATQQRTYAIAVSIPIGNNLNIAQEILRGVAQAQDEINHAGGINGVSLEVTIIDDDNDPTIAKQVADILVSDQKILAVIGHNTGDVSLSAAPIYQQHQLVMISPTTFNTEVAKVGDYIFRAVPTSQSMSAPLVDYIVKRSLTRSPQSAKTLICYDPTAPDQAEFRDSFVDALTNQGGEVVKVVDEKGQDRCDYSSPAFDPQRAVADAIAQGTNSIFLGTNVNNFGPTLEVIHANKQRLPLFSTPTLYTQKILQEGQADVNGLILVAPWNPDAYPDFASRARALWGATVNWRTATAYDAARAVIAGLQQGNTRQTLQQALQNPNFSTPGSGDLVRFLDTHDRRLKPILVQVQPNGVGGYRFVSLR
jgi:branched-chain amino acid transport system substrate-binding protein